jgi:23S rRNA (adenine2503-C2)-methyltransferase
MLRFIQLSKKVPTIGLQFSLHKSQDKERNILIPFHDKLSIEELRDYGLQWWKETGRKPFCNYCVDGENNKEQDFNNLRILFAPNAFNFTFSVVCAKDENMRKKSFRNLNVINEFRERFVKLGYTTRTFDPAGQDDIGGGCGQLWYVQDYLNKITNQK